MTMASAMVVMMMGIVVMMMVIVVMMVATVVMMMMVVDFATILRKLVEEREPAELPDMNFPTLLQLILINLQLILFSRFLILVKTIDVD